MEGGEGEAGREFLDGVRAGDPDSWDEVLRRLYPRLRAFGARRVAPDEVDDIVSETMTRAVTNIGRFHGEEGALDGWLFGIARNVAADHQRRLRRFRRTDRHRVDIAPTSPDEALLLDSDHASVRAAFDKLSPTERDVLELRVIGGLSAEQTALALGKRAGAVRVAQSRALAHLRRLLDTSDE